MDYYFIYGTLKKDMKNHHIMERVQGEYIADVETVKSYPMFDLGNGFPYIQNIKGKGSILQGELWKVEAQFSNILDEFEGVPTLYKRGTITVELENLKYEDVNCYFIVEELDNLELEEVDYMEIWEEDKRSDFDFEEYYKKLLNNLS